MKTVTGHIGLSILDSLVSANPRYQSTIIRKVVVRVRKGATFDAVALDCVRSFATKYQRIRIERALKVRKKRDKNLAALQQGEYVWAQTRAAA